MFQVPSVASSGISYSISNKPSAVSENVFSNVMRPRASRICRRTGIPASDLKDLFFTIPPRTNCSPGR